MRSLSQVFPARQRGFSHLRRCGMITQVDLLDNGNAMHRGKMTTIEDAAFRALADLYPHECYEQWPDRFIAYVQSRAPHLSREGVIRLLEETKQDQRPEHGED